MWPLAAVLAGTQDELHARVGLPGQATLLTDAGTLLTDVAAAVRRLVAAGQAVTVRIQRADDAVLRTLAEAGAGAIEWTVRAPTDAAALALTGATDEADQLRDAIGRAGELGLAVRLRWRLVRAATAGLQDLAALAGLGTHVEVIVLPVLTPEDAPALGEVSAAWPATTPAGVTVLRSGLWPDCLGGRDVEPPSQAERAHAARSFLAPCEGCALRASPQWPEGCTGVAAALHAPTATAATPWRAWQTMTHGVEAASHTHVDPACVEARGLALGLRRAWRLFVAPDDVAAYAEVFLPRGLFLASAAGVDAGVGGTVRARGQQVLLVIAQTQAEADACVADELDNLHRATSTVDMGADQRWHAIAQIHRRLGAAYGYPACCVEAFLDAHAEIVELARDTDNALPLLRAALRTRSFDPALLSLPGLLGEEAGSVLRHMPCRFDCPASQGLAQTLLADLEVHNLQWIARATPARPHVALADGSLLVLEGTPQTPDEVVHVRKVDLRLSRDASPELRAALDDWTALLPIDAMACVPGVGLRMLRDGVWSILALPVPPVPRAAEFPVLLPFGQPGDA